VSLELRSLLLGRLEPRAIDLAGVSLRVFRAEDGAVALDVGTLAEALATPPEAPPSGAPPERVATILEELGLAPVAADGPRTRFSRLRVVRIRNAALVVDDRQVGGRWSVLDVRLLMQRRAVPGGTALGLEATGTAQAGEARLALRLRASIAPDGSAEATLGFDPLRPAEVAAALPGLAALAAVDAPLSGTIGLARIGHGAIVRGTLSATLGQGQVVVPGAAPLPVLSASVTARYDAGDVSVDALRLALPGTHGPAPTITGTARAVPREGGGWTLTASVAADAMAAGDLPLLWPEGIGGNEREWITENITAGLARDAQVTLRATIPATLDDIVPDHLEGTLRAEGLTVHYLRPMPPLEGVSGEMRLGLATIDITASGGRLGAITVPEGTIRLYDLDRRPNKGDIKVRIASTIPDALALLAHPRLDLLSRRGGVPPGMTGNGTVALSIGLPLVADISMDDLAVSVTANAGDVRVPAILAGRDFQRGRIELSADRDGLRFSGTGAFEQVAADVRGEIDFRDGPASQVIERYSARVAPQEGIPALFEFDLAPYLTGPVGAEAVLETRRNGQSVATVKADLTPTRIAVADLAVEKPPGGRGSAEGRITLAPGGRVTGAEITRFEAGEIVGRAQFGMTRDGRLDRIEVPEGRIGGSRLGGSVRLPQGERGAYAVVLRAPVIDLSGRGIEARAPVADQPPARMRPVNVEATVDRVIMTPGHELREMRGSGTYAGGVIARADISGRMGERGTMRAQITPSGQRRALSLTADDAGALLNALDVITTMAGGTLTVRGSFDDTAPGRPLSGEAEIVDFRMREAPAAARVLQAMTLYGLLDLARGPGLSFSRAVAPFSLTGQRLELRDARAFGSSLGFTAKGVIDRGAGRVDLEGTIVPAYFFNSLLGNIPIIGRIFSPEQGGGLFAATYRVRGPLNDPEASVNPLAALTPGFLRGLFGVFEGGQGPATMPPADVPEHQRGG
jgi:hypothetical protein